MRPLWLSKSASTDKLLSRQIQSIVFNKTICGVEKGTALLRLAVVRSDALEKNYLAATAVSLMRPCILKHAAEGMQKYVSHVPMQISKSYGSLMKSLTCDRCGYSFETAYMKGKRVSCNCNRLLADW